MQHYFNLALNWTRNVFLLQEWKKMVYVDVHQPLLLFDVCLCYHIMPQFSTSGQFLIKRSHTGCGLHWIGHYLLIIFNYTSALLLHKGQTEDGRCLDIILRFMIVLIFYLTICLWSACQTHGSRSIGQVSGYVSKLIQWPIKLSFHTILDVWERNQMILARPQITFSQWHD